MVVLCELSEGSSSSSSSTHIYRYDVFLSFRGLDTRHGFTAHLHKAFMEANIITFLDDEEIDIGEDLKPELESAIKASRASVIVLSENYASSTWCLDELVLILEQCTIFNHIVFPIFYHVEPTHIRKQQRSFGDAMAKHRRMMEAEINANKRSNLAQKMERWNKALTEVAGLKGMAVNGRNIMKFDGPLIIFCIRVNCKFGPCGLPKLVDGVQNILPVITVSNITQNQTWMYNHYIKEVNVGGESVIMLSHWMFGTNEMEAGDHVTITVKPNSGLIKDCGVSFVYNEEEDVLGYYKSWNYIIGGDLAAFQLTTGEYILDTSRFLLPGVEFPPYKEPLHFKAFL